MELLADRFLIVERDAALDLATGERVRIILGMQGAASEHARWAARCARLAALRHRRLAVLIDYGTVGDVRRFEAWRGADDARADGDSPSAVRGARVFLTAIGLSVGDGCGCVRDGDEVRVLPDAETGYETPEHAETAEAVHARADAAGTGVANGAVAPTECGVALVARPSLEGVCEWLQQRGSGARALSLWAPPGAGLNTALLHVSRSARLQGFIPLCPRMATPEVVHFLRGRSCLLIAREGQGDAWRLLLELSVHARRGHMMLWAGASPLKGTPAVVVERVSKAQLIGAVRPIVSGGQPPSAVIAAAESADGLPAAFVRHLWRIKPVTPLRVVSTASRAAEPAFDYAPSTSPGLDAGARLFAQGHAAAGERRLRQSLGECARRRDWAGASRAAVALAQALLARGRVQNAGAAIDQAREFAAAGQDVGLMLNVAIVSGLHALEQLRLDEARAVLSVARGSARSCGDAAGSLAASLALARVCCWRGRFDEARDALAEHAPEALTDDARVQHATLRARIALGDAQLAVAVACASEAVESAERCSPSACAGAWATLALVHLAVGDRSAVARDVETALARARIAHEPLTALRARLLYAESERRAGRPSAAARLVARLTRPSAPRLPPLLSTRVQLLAAQLKDSRSDAAMRLVKSSGLGGLALYLPPAPAPAGESPVVVSSLLDLLRTCQAADDDAKILQRVCGQLRDATGALGVSVFADEQRALVPVAAVGKADPEAAGHVQRLGDVVGPRPGELTGSSGGAPVRWGGQIIGVLQVGWPPRESEPPAHVCTIVSAAAVAIAPVLASERTRRLRAAATQSDLLGISDAMAKIRAAVERAAAAPFAVLIEGESGSGKELVARALHRRGPRRDRGCCAVNCAALPDDLLESELFGHARGAFTGAMAERVGVFEEANGGTLFLDEVGELSPRAQAKLLRAIQEGEIRRVGENTPRRVDARIVAATNRRLHDDADAGRFRQDLLYRLDVIRISVPPLRDRAEDVPLLADHFWREAAARVGSRATLGADVMAVLSRYRWPGNVRELQNVLAALVVRVPPRGVVSPLALPEAFHRLETAEPHRLEDARRRFDVSFVRAALSRAGGHRVRAAEELGLTRQGLAKLMLRLGLENDDASAAARVS